MKSELLSNGKFTISGSSVLKMMQNNSTPAIDLVVRESIQNSLDASIPGEKITLVNFIVKDFDTYKLADNFEGIADNIKNKFGNNKAKYLAIQDKNTVGLTGNLDGVFKPGEQNQNLGKLVFNIMKAQDKEGAGGSWGIGKTVYFRIGVGLVIYYSRIKLSNGEYQNRLVAALVEDENKKDGLLSNYPSNLGVAFFGDGKDENKITTITNSNEISKFLNIFGLNPYFGNQTGTTIIIPFIDEQSLLNSNKCENEEKLWWQDELQQYLKVSILRWYFPRLCKNYPIEYGTKLNVFIDDELLTLDDETKVFLKFEELYNACYSNISIPEIKKINIERSDSFQNKVLGFFAYRKITKEDLHMISKHFPSPFSYCLCQNNSGERNSPIIAFVRKPGMVVNYQVDGLPVGSISTDKDEYILGVFSLNSSNSFTKPIKLNLDEYIRQSEKSDHTTWNDHEIVKNQNKILVVNSIYKKIKEELNSSYGDKTAVTGEGSINTNFAKKFGKIFLPDESFGEKGSTRTKTSEGGRSGKGSIRTKNKNVVIFNEKKFEENDIILEYKFKIVGNLNSIKSYTSVNTINGQQSYDAYEENGLAFPFEITNAFVKLEKFDSKPVKNLVLVNLVDGACFNQFNISALKRNDGKIYGFCLRKNVDSLKPLEFILRVKISSSDRLVQLHFENEIEEGN